VFFYDDKVYKIFDNDDTELGLWPKIEAIKAITENYLPGLKLVDLSHDKWFQHLEYTYLQGSHQPHSLTQCLSLLKDTQKLHVAEYV